MMYREEIDEGLASSVGRDVRMDVCHRRHHTCLSSQLRNIDRELVEGTPLCETTNE